jgi:hypothetical protein
MLFFILNTCTIRIKVLLGILKLLEVHPGEFLPYFYVGTSMKTTLLTD